MADDLETRGAEATYAANAARSVATTNIPTPGKLSVPTGLKFPSELGTPNGYSHWVHFRAYDYQYNPRLEEEPRGSSGLTTANEQSTSLADLKLATPDQLQYGMSPEWNVVDLAELAAASSVADNGLVETLKSTARDAYRAGSQGGGAAETIKNIAQAAGFAGSSVLSMAPAAVTAFAGITPNPRKQPIFQGMGPRSFSFSWNLTPKSEKDCKIVQDVIKTFRKFSAPKRDGNFLFKFPKTWTMDFYFINPQTGKAQINSWLPKLTEMVCTSVYCNYTSAGMWAAFKNGHPLDVQISMSFLELVVLHEELIEKGF